MQCRKPMNHSKHFKGAEESVVVSATAFHTGGPGSISGQYPEAADMLYLVFNSLSTLGTLQCESENNINVGLISVWRLTSEIERDLCAFGS